MWRPATACSLALAASAAVLGSCAFGGRGAPAPAEFVRSVRDAIDAGDLDYAGEVSDFACATHPRNPRLLVWSAFVRRMQWHDRAALEDLRAAWTAAAGEPSLRAEIAARLGMALFDAGRWAESRRWLDLVGPGVEDAAALVRLVSGLPFRAVDPGVGATELPLLGRRPPAMLCRINEVDVPLVLDTGASWTTLSSGCAAELGMVRDPAPIVVRDAAGRPLSGRLAIAFGLRVGTLELGRAPVLVIDDERLAVADDEVAGPGAISGLLGLDVLSRFRFTLDPRRRALLLEEPRGLPPVGSVPCARSRGCVLVPVTIEGREHWFVLDTGASRSSLTPAGLARLNGGASRAEPVHLPLRSVGGRGVAVRAVRRLSLDVAAARFVGVELPVVPREVEEGPGLPVHGVLGADLLLECYVTFDRGRLRVEPQSSTARGLGPGTQDRPARVQGHRSAAERLAESTNPPALPAVDRQPDPRTGSDCLP